MITGSRLLAAIVLVGAAISIGVAPALAITERTEDEQTPVLVRVRTDSADPVIRQLLRDPDTRSFLDLGVIAVDLDDEALANLASSKDVEALQHDDWLRPTLDVSAGTVGASQAWSVGMDGSGEAVAIIDTGVDASHPFLQGKVVHEACFTQNTCPNGATTQIGAGAARPCFGSGCAHGTHVAGVVAGTGASLRGVAPGASILAIQVFTSVSDSAICGAESSPCARARVSDVLSALDHLQTIRSQFDFSAANLSLSGDAARSTCDDSVLKGAVDGLVTRGVATVVASGNAASKSGLGLPACISSTISVGATADDDAVWPFTNSSPALDFLAPGVGIVSSDPTASTGFAAQTGTSTAAPHVAGGWAIASQFLGTNDVATIASHLRANGRPIVDPGNGVSTPRLDLAWIGDSLTPATAKSPTGSRAVVGNFDGDGHDDVFWYSGGSDEIWFGTQSGSFDPGTSGHAQPGQIPVEGDFDGDGRDDIFWYAPNGSESLWRGRSSRQFSIEGGPNVRHGGLVAVSADYNGDGRDDIFWYAPGPSPDYIWFGRKDGSFDMGRGPNVRSVLMPKPGDFNGDGRGDIFWYAPGPSPDYIWFGTSRRTFDGRLGPNVVAVLDPLVGDFNLDGKDDIYWYGDRSSSYLWTGQGNGAFTSKGAGSAGAGLAPFAGDFDGDGRDEIYWRDPRGGAEITWKNPLVSR